MATGPARVVLHPADTGDLLPGVILVAPATDRLWTPLFVSASLVVVDVDTGTVVTVDGPPARWSSMGDSAHSGT